MSDPADARVDRPFGPVESGQSARSSVAPALYLDPQPPSGGTVGLHELVAPRPVPRCGPEVLARAH